jgi:hypothetical protein
MSESEALKSQRIQAALELALDGGPTRDLFDLLERSSGHPGPRPNVDLAKAIGKRLASEAKRGLGLTEELLEHKNEYFVRVGLMALAARASTRGDRTGALRLLHDKADETRKSARDAVIDALESVLLARGDELVPELAAFTDGFLHAFVVLEALTRRQVLDKLSDGEAVLARIGEAFDLADASSRAAERAQGVRLLREGLPKQITRTAQRFGETLAFLEPLLSRKRPETRAVLEATLSELRKTTLSDASTARLRAMLAETAPPPRDPSRIVAGTRKRSRGRS